LSIAAKNPLDSGSRFRDAPACPQNCVPRQRVATDSAFLSVGLSHANVPNSQRLPSPEITLFAKKNPRTGKQSLATHLLFDRGKF